MKFVEGIYGNSIIKERRNAKGALTRLFGSLFLAVYVGVAGFLFAQAVAHAVSMKIILG